MIAGAAESRRSRRSGVGEAQESVRSELVDVDGAYKVSERQSRGRETSCKHTSKHLYTTSNRRLWGSTSKLQ